RGGRGGGMGGLGGGWGGMGGGGYGGGMGGMGGGGYGGGMGGMGGGMGGMGGGMGGMGGGMGGMGVGMGMGGGMGGMGMGGLQIYNISQLFGTYPDMAVGEPPATIGIAGLSMGGTGALGATGTTYGGGLNAGTQPAGLGATAGRSQTAVGDEPEIVRLLRMLIDDVYEPNGIEPISRMIYVPQNNLLIVHNTPSNLRKLEQQLAELDATPKQVSIEAKFLTVSATDLDKIGFSWNSTQSDRNDRNRQIPDLADNTYLYDLNGDGVPEEIPFYNRPNGSNVIGNTITEGVLEALVSPGPAGAFSLSGIITDNEDGDTISAVFDYLNTLEESELLSAPRVTTMNRKPAVIADLQSEYFVSRVVTSVITSEAGLAGSSALGYTQDVIPTVFNFGITLSVTPQISGTDQVRLWLNPQVTTRGIEKNFTQKSVINGTELTSTITLPNQSTQAVWTNVIVHDGDTLVLGGLVSDSTIKSVHKMPYLADIPVLGFFFRGKSRQVRQSSLLIFVTPTIIDTTGARFFEAGFTSSSAYPRRTGEVGSEAPAKQPLPGAEPTLEPKPPSAEEVFIEPPAPSGPEVLEPATPASPIAPVVPPASPVAPVVPPVTPPAAELSEAPAEPL
ncbi:MAG: hypothetical protein NTZ09_14565, partial [Candidatus Hydrogenedentes bacterium]|nr:hypothetical protein [Candidatus Hydrogenedentota bacterium]